MYLCVRGLLSTVQSVQGQFFEEALWAPEQLCQFGDGHAQLRHQGLNQVHEFERAILPQNFGFGNFFALFLGAFLLLLLDLRYSHFALNVYT